MKLAHSSLPYQRHRSRLITYACTRGCPAQDAEDVVQDLFAALVRVGRYDELHHLPVDEQGAALCCRLKSLLINRWRDQHRQRRDQSRTVALADAEDFAMAIAMDSTPATDLDRAWAMDAIEAALERLRPEVAAHHWHIVEPALRGETAIASATERVALSRARKRLRTFISHADLHAALCTSSHQP